jgi:glucose/arabinose dehydrogenase
LNSIHLDRPARRAAFAAALILASSTAAVAQPDPVGKHFHIRPGDLPGLGESPVGSNQPPRGAPAGPAPIAVPEGFKAEVFAEEGFAVPRNIQVGPGGDYFLVDSGRGRGAGRVFLLRDADGDGKADFRSTFAEGLNRPFGIAFIPGYVYVANTNSVVRFAHQSGQTEAQGPPEVVVPELPSAGNHWTRNLLFSPDGSRLFISVGSASNVGVEPENRAAVLVCDPDGANLRVFAGGLRNPVALTIEPTTGDLWTSVNERDGLGDDLVPDYVTSVKEGGFYGWPYYYIGPNPDPRFGEARPDLRDKTIVPDVLVTSHSAALGATFYTGTAFPAEYRGNLFVAFHGSWNRTERTGYKVVRVPMQDGRPVGGYINFMTGFMPDASGPDIYGRPVMVTQTPDGALLVVEDLRNQVWRISYTGQ